MTPAINLLKKHKVSHQVHSYSHEPGSAGYGLEAAEKLGIEADRVFKTLLVKLDQKALAVAVVPVSGMLGMKQMAKSCKARKAAMAEQAEAERSTGYLVGGISPLGQKKLLTTVIDSSAQNFKTVFVSAGRRGLEIELAPTDLALLLKAKFDKISACD
jgi:Cys-tRNA(Pro)/Cys-tRNA(Cys) deacylase